MNLPPKMKEMLDDESPEFRELFSTVYRYVEKLGLSFHPQGSPNVIAEHPRNRVNCVALWIKGRKGERRIEGEVRVDGFRVDDLSMGMRDEIIIHKYDRDKKPLWWLSTIEVQEDIEKLCLMIKRVISKVPDWGVR